MERADERALGANVKLYKLKRKSGAVAKLGDPCPDARGELRARGPRENSSARAERRPMPRGAAVPRRLASDSGRAQVRDVVGKDLFAKETNMNQRKAVCASTSV